MTTAMIFAARDIIKGDVQRARETICGTGRSWRVCELRALVGALRVANGMGWDVGTLEDWIKLAEVINERI